LKLVFDYSDRKGKLKIPLKFKNIVREIELQEKRKLGEICFIFVSRERMLYINRFFLKHDYVTDVITFSNNIKSIIAGDIYICTDVVLENADLMNVLFSEEILRVMVHGILHLKGYQDDNKKSMAIMRLKENYYLEFFNKMGVKEDGSNL